MGLTYNTSPSAAFAALQERLESQASDTKSQSGGTVITSKKSNAKVSNYARHPIFKKHSKKLVADKKYIDKYKQMLSENYVKALQMQLNVSARGQRNGIRTRFQNVGFASGRLYKAIKADTRVTIRHDEKKGRYNIYYRIKEDFSSALSYNAKEYGTYLNYFRPARAFNKKAILEWMKHKMSQKGGLKIYNRYKKNNPDAGLSDMKKARERIANSIVASFAKEPRSAVLENWSIYDKNKKLQKDFENLTKYKAAYHRQQIRKSIIKNLNK